VWWAGTGKRLSRDCKSLPPAGTWWILLKPSIYSTFIPGKFRPYGKIFFIPNTEKKLSMII